VCGGWGGGRGGGWWGDSRSCAVYAGSEPDGQCGAVACGFGDVGAGDGAGVGLDGFGSTARGDEATWVAGLAEEFEAFAFGHFFHALEELGFVDLLGPVEVDGDK